MDTLARRSASGTRLLAQLLLAVGWLAAVWGAVFVANGLTQAGATIKVPVTTAGTTGGSADVQTSIAGVDVPGGWLSGARPTGLSFSTPDSALTLAAGGSTAMEQLLGRGEWLVAGIALLIGALALRPVLLGIAGGQPFTPGAPRRLAVVAGVVVLGGFVAPLLPQVAGHLALDRLGLLVGGRFSTALSFDPVPLLVAALVLAVAAAFREGERMRHDLAGLV